MSIRSLLVRSTSGDVRGIPPRRYPLVGILLSLAILSQACLVSQKATGPGTPVVQDTAFAPSAAPTQATDTPVPTEDPATGLLATATERPVPSPTIALVTITAREGNLAIRTGPDPVFDAVGTLRDGETATVLARSVLDGWVEIPMPSQPGTTGWVSTKTAYSVVNGNVLDLPLIRTVEWPFGSYLQNCTSHQMIVEPGDLPLPANSKVWFPPGLYSVYDTEVAGHPIVMNVKLWQHIQINVRKDGIGQTSTCP